MCEACAERLRMIADLFRTSVSAGGDTEVSRAVANGLADLLTKVGAIEGVHSGEVVTRLLTVAGQIAATDTAAVHGIESGNVAMGELMATVAVGTGYRAGVEQARAAMASSGGGHVH